MRYGICFLLALASFVAFVGCNNNTDAQRTKVTIETTGVSSRTNGGEPNLQTDVVPILNSLTGNNGASAQPAATPAEPTNPEPAQVAIAESEDATSDAAPGKESGKPKVAEKPTADEPVEDNAPIAPPTKMKVSKPGVDSNVQKQADY